jgi:galactonate dehydratase
MNRREYLTTAAAVAAGTAKVAEIVGQDKNPAALVADKTSSLKITGLRTYWVNPVVFIKIETNHGLTGWGEIKAIDPRVAKVLVESLFALIEGENPTRIEYLWQKVYRAHRDIRGGPFMVHTLAGIDIALWDLVGKLWREPVYRLLGGPCRDRIRVYHTPKAVKVPPHGIYEHSSSPADIDRMVKVIKEAREKVGSDGAVMFDAHCALPPATLIQFAAAVLPYDLLFLEEPAVPGNIEVFKRIKESVIPYLHERCLDVLQPDCCHTGGITQMKKIAVLAEAYQVPIAPHCTASMLGISASLHAACSVPLFLIHEFYPDNMGFNPKGLVKMHYEMDKEGYITLPPGPGLGVEIDEKGLEEAAKKPQAYQWPGAKLKDGSIADY